MCTTLEGEVKSLEDIPFERELTVPEIALREDNGNGFVVVEVLHVTALLFVVGAVDFGSEG